MEKIEDKKNTGKGLNLMDLFELMAISILELYLIWKNISSEKVSPVEIAIIAYLSWEFFKKIKKLVVKNQT